MPFFINRIVMKIIRYAFLAVAMLVAGSAWAQTAAQINLLKKQAMKGNIQSCAKLAAYYRANWMLDDAETYYTKQIILLNKKKQSNEAGHLQLFTCDKAGDGWTESHICRGLQEDCDINYPFVNSEGTKMYYSSNSREGIGGYDIYMTRENGDGTGFVEPANLGYPFNSEFNEYLYVEDDVNQLGWLVSDRYQPEGKVCIYIFIPEGLRTSYDYNDPDERKQCQKVAMLHSLKDTWTDKDAVDEALERLAFVRNQSEAAKNVVPKKEFTFVVDDDHVYYYLSDFKSPSAYTSVNNWLARKKHFEDMSAKLEQQRLVYASSSVAERQRMANSLYQLEEQVFELEDLVKQVEKNLRKEELSALGLLR